MIKITYDNLKPKEVSVLTAEKTQGVYRHTGTGNLYYSAGYGSGLMSLEGNTPMRFTFFGFNSNEVFEKVNVDKLTIEIDLRKQEEAKPL